MANKKIYIGNLSYDATQDDVISEFSTYGEIEEFKLIHDHETGRSKGFGFMTFESSEAAESALEKNGELFGERKLKVSPAEDRKKPSKSW